MLDGNDAHNNPLCSAILAVLRQYPAGIKEYDLLNTLREHPMLSTLAAEGYLALFQKHFLLMNGLYQLQQQLWHEENVVLLISPLNIQLTSRKEVAGTTLPQDAANSALQSYYLDWGNFTGTAEEDVRALLDDFWKRFIDVDAKQAAFDTLNLDSGASLTRVRQRYRELAAAHHPDKGGNSEVFIKIREAYEVLKNALV